MSNTSTSSVREKNKLVPELRFPEFVNDGEWEKKTIAAISDSESSNMALNRLELKQIGYPVYGADSIVGYIDEYQQEEKYISIVKDGSGVGRLNLCESHSSILGTLACLKSKNKKQFDLVWFYYLLNTVDFSVYVKGSGIPHIYYSDFKSEDISVPKPQEQQKIAFCLSSLDEVITAHSQKLDALKAHKKGLMQNLFLNPSTSSGGERVPKYRFPEFAEDGDWKEEELGEVTIKVGSGVTPLGGESVYKKNGRPFVRSQNVGWGIFLIENIAFIDEETHQNSINTEIEKEDVLLNITGASIGRSAVANKPVSGGNVNQHVCIIRTKKKYLSPFFLCQYLISAFGQKQIDSFQAGGNRQGLNFAQIRSFSIPIPSTPKEQQKIASCLTALDDLITAQAEKIAQLQQHKKGLMQGLFPKIEN